MKVDRALITALLPVIAVDLVGVAVTHRLLVVDDRVLAAAAGAVIAGVVLVLAARSTAAQLPSAAAPAAEPSWPEMLARKRSSAEILLRHADGSRGEWDRHIRPLLAREFQASLGYRGATDRAALRDLGSALLGPDLWRWVDPSDAAVLAQADPGPGRDTLVRIIDRLDRL
ncbi:hypothetical protein ACRS6B_00600 [Nocardia asteroides]